MPRLNARGQALLGRGSGPASVDGRVVVDPGGGPASWFYSDHGGAVVVNTSARTGQWETCLVEVESGALTRLGPTANDLVAGGDRWLGWNPQQGLFGNVGNLPTAGGVRGAGLDGTLAYCPDRQAGVGLVLLASDGQVTEVPGAVVYDEYALQVLGPATAVWYDGTQVRTVGLDYALRFATPPGKARVVELPGGLEVLVYWAPALDALVAQENGYSDGWILQQEPYAFNHDALAVDGEVVVAWAVSAGEAPGDLRKITLDRTRPKVPLVPTEPPLRIPTFAFSHPVLLAPFKASGSGLPDAEYDLGVFSEAEDPAGALAAAEAQGKRLVLGHDAPSDWTLPAGLRPWDLPLLEWYRLPAETLEASVARWTRQLDQLLAQWPGSVGGIPMAYTQNRWTIQEVLDALAPISALVNRSPRVQVPAPFAYNRANGVVSDPALEEAFENLRAAAEAAGLATLPPVGVTPEPPRPDPPRPDPPRPQPPSPYLQHKEFSMTSDQRGVLRGPGGKLARPDAPNTGPWASLHGWRGLVFDGENDQKGDPRYQFLRPATAPDALVSLQTHAVLGCDATLHSGGLDQQFYLKPDGDTSQGWAERWQFYAGNANGAIQAQVEYAPGSGGDAGPFFSYPLAWEVIG